MVELAAILFGVLFTVAACCGLGRPLARSQGWLFAFVVGSAVLSLLVFVLSAAGIAGKASFLVLGAGAIITLLLFRRGSRTEPLKTLPYAGLACLLAIPFTVLYLSQALGPEYSPDGSDYHLGLVLRYLHQSGFGHITTSLYANLSQGLEMLFLFAFAFGRHSAAAGVHYAFLLALTLGLISYARRFGLPAAGICAALLVYLSPVVGFDGTAAYNDVAAACVIFFLFYLLESWDQCRDSALLVPAGLLAGFAYAIKYTAFPAVPYALGYVAWRSRRFRPAATVALCAAIMITPWIAKNWIAVGNPFSPFLNRWFPNPYTNVAFEASVQHGNGIHRDGFTLAGSVTDMTVRGHLSRGLLGPVFLLAPLALFALRWPRGRRLLAAAAVFALAWPANVDTRFLILALPFLALALGLVLQRIPAAIPVVLLAHAYLSWPTVTQRYCDPLAQRVRHFAPRETLRIAPEAATLAYRLPGYRVARMLEQNVPPSGMVLAFSTPPRAYTSRDVLVWWESSFNEAARDVLLMPLRPETQPLWRWRFDFPSQSLRALRIVETARDPAAQWSIGEIHSLADPRAEPNPWDAHWAVDGNPVTRWRSLAPLEPGMHFDLDFKTVRQVDGLTLDCAHDQWSLQLRLEGQDRQGRWTPLPAKVRKSEVPPFRNLRAPAVAGIASRGFTHLLLRDADFGAQDFRSCASSWGIRLLGEVEGWRLYILERPAGTTSTGWVRSTPCD